MRRVGGAKENFLTLIRIFDTFTFYGADVALLAGLTAGATQLVKMTLFKRAQKKLVTFLPFILGTLFYACYAALRNLSFQYLLTEYTSVLEHGISVGAVSTLYYVLYEQCVRVKSGTSESEKVITALIENYVPAENVEKTAKAIAEAIEKDVTGNGAKKAEEIILSLGGENLNEADVKLLCRLIVETLAHVNVR